MASSYNVKNEWVVYKNWLDESGYFGKTRSKVTAPVTSFCVWFVNELNVFNRIIIFFQETANLIYVENVLNRKSKMFASQNLGNFTNLLRSAKQESFSID